MLNAGRKKTGARIKILLIRVGCSCFFKILYPFVDAIFAVCLFPFIKDVVNGDIRKGSVIFQIFHELFFLLIKLLENGVFLAIEVKGSDVIFFAQFDIECGGGLDPFSVQIKFRIPMIDKQI